jgi:hypothetical protein
MNFVFAISMVAGMLISFVLGTVLMANAYRKATQDALTYKKALDFMDRHAIDLANNLDDIFDEKIKELKK